MESLFSNKSRGVFTIDRDSNTDTQAIFINCPKFRLMGELVDTHPICNKNLEAIMYVNIQI